MRLDINNRPLWVHKAIVTLLLSVVLLGVVILGMCFGYGLYLLYLHLNHLAIGGK
jgi:hypothetical protein